MPPPVRVRYHDSAKPALADWFNTLGRTTQERRDWFGMFWEAFAARLGDHAGVPPEAVCRDTGGEPVYTMQCAGDVYVEYVLREEPPPPRAWWDLVRRLRRVIRRPVLSAVVLALTGPPPRG